MTELISHRNTFLSSALDRTVKIWQSDTLSLLYQINLPEPKDAVTCMAICHSPSFLENLVVFTQSKHFYIIEVSEQDDVVSH